MYKTSCVSSSPSPVSSLSLISFPFPLASTMRLYPFHYAPPSYPFRSFSDYYPRSMTHPEDSPRRMPRSSVIDIPVIDHRSPPSPSPPVSHAPRRPSESCPPSVPSQPTYSKRALSDSAAATIIQARFRGFSIRRHQPLLHLRSVAAARRQLEDLKAALESPEFTQRLRTDNKERLRVTEAIMTIILNLDAVKGSITDVRLRRKEATRMAISLQDMVDAIALQDAHGASDVNQENEDHACANGEYEPVLVSEKDDVCTKIMELPQDVTDLHFSQIESLPEDSLLLDRKSNGALPCKDGASTMEKDGSAIISAYSSENASYAQVIYSKQGDVESLYKSNDVVLTGDKVSLKEEGMADLLGHPSETAATKQIECAEQDAVQSTGKSKEMFPEKNDVSSTSDIDTTAVTGSSSENGCRAQAECAEQRDESAITEQTKYAEQIVAGPGCDSFDLPLHKDSVTQMKEDSSGVVGGYSSDNTGNAQIKFAEQCSMQSECGCLKECRSRRGSIIALDEMVPDCSPFKPFIPGAGCAGAVTISSQDNENLHCGDDEEHHKNTHHPRLTPDVMCMSALGHDKELALDNLREGATSPCSLGHENVPLSDTNFCTKYEKNCDEMHNAPTSQCEGFTPENYALEDNAHSHYNLDHCQLKDCSKSHENAEFSSSKSGLQQLIDDNKQLKNLLGKLLLQSRAQSKVICALGERLEMLEHQQQKLISSQKQGYERKYPKKKPSKLRRRPSFFEALE